MLALAGVLVLASACGYQLRGSQGLPQGLSRVSIHSASSELTKALTLLLEANGVDVAVDVAADDAVTIRLGPEAFTERVLSVDPRDGKAREFEVAYRLKFSVLDRAGKTVLAPQELKLVRDYVFDRDAVIGKSRERGLLHAEMRQDAVQQILYRLPPVP